MKPSSLIICFFDYEKYLDLQDEVELHTRFTRTSDKCWDISSTW